MRRLVALVTVIGLSCLGLVSSVTPAGAKVVGANGQIAFARFDPNVGDTVTFIANADGTGLRALFPGVGTGLPRWSPDGSRLAILAGLDNPCPPCAASTIILNPDTGSYRVLSPPDPNLSTACSIWSPDAKRFACETESNDPPALAPNAHASSYSHSPAAASTRVHQRSPRDQRHIAGDRKTQVMSRIRIYVPFRIQ